MSPTIHALQDKTVAVLTAHQVISDLSSAIQELIDNAIDAKSTTIDVKFTHYGVDSFSVSDNGCGIPEQDHPSIALMSTTSKFKDMHELDGIMAGHSLGFRGQALHALCVLSRKVTLVTSTAGGAAATKLVFDSAGNLVSSTTTHAQQGTTVLVDGLFTSLPVRASEFRTNMKRDFSRALATIQHYSIACVRHRIVVSHRDGCKSTTLFATPTPPLTEPKLYSVNLSSIFDSHVIKHWVPVNWSMATRLVSISGGLTSGPTARHTSDRQFVMLNHRPVEIPILSRTVTQAYRTLYPNLSSQFPVFVLNLVIPPGDVDVNVNPNKRTVLLSRENEIMSAFRAYLVSTVLSGTATKLPVVSLTAQVQPSSFPRTSPASLASIVSTPSSLRLERRLASLSSPTAAKKRGSLTPTTTSTHLLPNLKHDPCPDSCTSDCPTKNHRPSHHNGSSLQPMPPNNLNENPTTDTSYPDPNIPLPDPATFDPIDPKVHRTLDKADFNTMSIVGQFNLGFIVAKRGNDLFLIDQHAADEKSRYEHLVALHLGARCSISESAHLVQRPKHRVQHLVVPLEVTLPPDMIDHALDDPRVGQFGFRVKCTLDTNDRIAASGPRPNKFGRVYLYTVPIDARGRPLGVNDFMDVLVRLRDEPSISMTPPGVNLDGDLFRPDDSAATMASHVHNIITDTDRAALASRACRSSVMIGMPLDKSRMQDIVSRLTGLDHPWNCPHGRPTVRHLVDLHELLDWQGHGNAQMNPELDCQTGTELSTSQSRRMRSNDRLGFPVTNHMKITWSGSLFGLMNEPECEGISELPCDAIPA